MTDQISELKRRAAEKAVEFIEDGMIVGLGTGSTTLFAIRKIGELIATGKLMNIKAIPSSAQSEMEATKLGINLITFDEENIIDITIDGADEVDEELNLIKGGGGALLREKVLAQNSKEVIIIVDENKLSERLGIKWHVPVEVIPFAEKVEEKFLTELGAKARVRYNSDGTKFVTDNGNIIIDADFGEISDLETLARAIERRAGILEHGLFIDLADKLIVASPVGVRIKTKK